MSENPYEPPKTSCEPKAKRSRWKWFEDLLPDSVWVRVAIGIVIALCIAVPAWLAFLHWLYTDTMPGQ